MMRAMPVPLSALLRPLTALALTLGMAAQAAPVAAPVPPVAPTKPHIVASPFGDRADEYHWLRDDHPRHKRPEVMRHLRAENAYAHRMMAPLARVRAELVAEMAAHVPADDSSPPWFDNGHWHWERFAKGAEYPMLMRRAGTPEGPDTKARDELVLDEARQARGQAFYSLGQAAVSPDGRWLAWTEDTRGRTTHTLRVRDLKTGRIQPDTVPGVMEQVVWSADSRHVFYLQQDPVTLQSGAVRRHALGTSARSDATVYEESDRTLLTGIAASASRQFLLIQMEGYDTTELRALATDRPAGVPVVIQARRPGVLSWGDHLGGRWVLRTNESALNFRLVEAPEAAPEDRARWKDLVPAREEAAVEGFALMHGGVVVEERVDAARRLRVLPGDGRPPYLVQGAAPTATMALLPHPDAGSPWLRYTVTSLTEPPATHDLNLVTGQSVLRKQQLVPGYDTGRYATLRTWARSRDGLRIPVVLAHRPDRSQADGQAPLLVEAYGAYGAPSDPLFGITRLPLLDRGFVIAIAQVRGGSEMGQSWYEGGRLNNKQNSFNDFVDATRHLVAEGWGDRQRVFASGGSAGGLLMAAVANQAGADFRGIAAHVPFVDVVTTMLDETIPLTANEWSQWGDPRRQLDHDFMLAYSPYDHLAAQAYPAMLVTSGLWDGQVQYYEPAKYVARLRARKTDAQPLLFAINMRTGHQGNSGRFERFKDAALEQAFFLSLAGLAPAMPGTAR
jgi:oligopeptidase B